MAGGKEKTQYLKETLGLDAVVDYKAGAIGNTLKAAAPEGIDIYFDNVGGDILEAVLMQINRHARIVVCGGISQYLDSEQVRGPANYLQLIAQSATMQGFTMRDYMSRASEAFMALAGWHAKGEIRFRDHVLLGIESFPQAFGMLFTGANQGKLLIQLESENS